MKIEIDSRNTLLKRLEKVKASLIKVVDKEVAKRAEKIEKLQKYDSVEEAHDAFGYGEITEEEYREVVEFFESGKKFITETKTKNSIALEILNNFISRLKKDVRALEWDMLSEDEKERIRKSNEELKKKYIKGVG